MTVVTRPLDTLSCSHDGIHGPDSEPGAVQRCTEETVLIRAQMSPEGKALSEAQERLSEAQDAYNARLVTETLRLVSEVGGLTTVVMDPTEDYGRTKPWDAEGIED